MNGAHALALMAVTWYALAPVCCWWYCYRRGHGYAGFLLGLLPLGAGLVLLHLALAHDSDQ